MPTIADQAITTGSLREAEQGDWFADVSTNSATRIPDGTRVDIVIENVTRSGAIVRGGITGDVGRYQVAGRPEWSNPVKPRAYQSAANVLRKTVLTDLCRDTLGANWAALVELPDAANLGNHFERPGTFGAVEVLARDVLELLEVPWYVRGDGVTVFGVRPSGTVSTAERILVSKRNDAIGYRVISCEDPAAFAPGLFFEGETIGDVTYAIRPGDIEIHVWTRKASNAFADAVRAAWRRMFPRVELQGLFSYTTVGPSVAGKHDLRSTRSRHLPDVRTCDAWTLAGHSAALQPGTRVLVSFADGDPTQPVIVAVDPSTSPQSSTFGAVASIGIDAASVDLGGAETRVLRSGDQVALVTWSPPAAPVPIPGVSPAFLIHVSDIGAPVPTVLPSRVKA